MFHVKRDLYIRKEAYERDLSAWKEEYTCDPFTCGQTCSTSASPSESCRMSTETCTHAQIPITETCLLANRLTRRANHHVSHVSCQKRPVYEKRDLLQRHTYMRTDLLYACHITIQTMPERCLVFNETDIHKKRTRYIKRDLYTHMRRDQQTLSCTLQLSAASIKPISQRSSTRRRDGWLERGT